nr:MAG TPA: hypothetical protein [Bacteriophage sp.]
MLCENIKNLTYNIHRIYKKNTPLRRQELIYFVYFLSHFLYIS